MYTKPMNMPVAKPSISMNTRVRPSGEPAKSGRARVLTKSFIVLEFLQVLFQLGTYRPAKMQLLGINAGRVFADGNLVQVKDPDQVQHPPGSAFFKLQLQDHSIGRKRS